MIVKEGKLVSVARIDDSRRWWVAHRMRRTIDAKRVGGSSGAKVLQYKDWLILTRGLRDDT